MSEKLVERTMTVTFKVPEDYLTGSTMEHLRQAMQAYASTMAYTRGALVEIDDPPTEGPEITGQVNTGGQVSKFRIPLDDDSVQYTQWGASNTVLWPRVDLMGALAEAGREWWADNRPANDNENEG